MTKPNILLVEDNKLVSETIESTLSEEGYNVITATSAQELKDKIATARPDTVLLDLILPDGNGLTLIEKIREHTDAPVIVISGKSDMVDKVVGLEMGADDYVGKPLQMKELAARVKAQIRRYKNTGTPGAESKQTKKADAERIRFGAWVLDRPRFQIYDEKGAPGKLTVSEFRLLEALVMEPDRVMSREQLLNKIRADNYDITDRAIDVQILRIRKKIGDKPGDSEIIRSVRGVGYMLVCPTEIL